MSDLILRDLSLLGCNFVVSKESEFADPEQTIISALNFFWTDKKIFTMMLSVFKYRLSHLINTKRLYTLIKEQDSELQALLRVLAIKVARYSGDQRYNELEQKLKKIKVKLKRVPKEYKEDFFIKRKGIDKDFKKVGVSLADFFEIQPERKLKSLSNIYKKNKWLKLRAIAGPDYRADIIYLFLSAKVQNQTEASKILKCNKSSVSRVINSFTNFNEFINNIEI